MTEPIVSALIGGLAGAAIAAISGLAQTWFNQRHERSIVKFSKWSEKRVEAVESAYSALCEYFDWLSRRFYFDRSDVTMDGYFSFKKALQKELLFLDDRLASNLQRYDVELLDFQNWAVGKLSRNGEIARHEIQYELDTRIPLHAAKFRADIADAVDPYPRRPKTLVFAKDKSGRRSRLHGFPVSEDTKLASVELPEKWANKHDA